jgi:hypothetical protein
LNHDARNHEPKKCYTDLAEEERGGVKMRCYPMGRDHIIKRYA